ncbi:MAG: LysR family transcriptional regulator [Clostridiales bacterium]|nr:LysR family transcriptional regulator [Clostridiales bacterium]MDO4351129.1 LysR family transcriptional regulator [Eubacteriales bacterium]MDY4008453.1 LysR family transcriptional regulator [Candidatus Limiplasma sp.]
MDTFSYRVFLTIVQYKSFQKAAELHHVTPPAISHLVKQLEKAFGFSLFVRSRHHVSLTTAGEAILNSVVEIVKKEDALNQLVSELNGLNRGHVRLGIFNSMCKYLPDVLRDFNRQYPHITFEIYQGSYEDIINWLKTGVVDIGFLSKTVNPGFPFHEIFADPLMCILKKDTPTESETEIHLESLADSSFVMQRESCDADARRMMDKLSLDVRTVCHVVDDKTTVEMVKSGFGFAIMPLMTMYGLEQDVKMLRIMPPEKRIIGVSVLNENELSPAVKKAFAFIRDYPFSD